MMRIMLLMFMLQYTFPVTACAFGELDLGYKSIDNKKHWETTIVVITGIVEKVERPKAPWVVMTIRPTALICGLYDPSATASMRIGLEGEFLVDIPKEGERVLMILFPMPRGLSNQSPDINPHKVDYRVPYACVRNNMGTIRAITRLPEGDDTIPLRLLEQIREIRALPDEEK